MNISSFVVTVALDRAEEVMEALGSLEHCDIFFNDGRGRIVITIESEGCGDELPVLDELHRIPGILSTALAYTYSEAFLQPKAVCNRISPDAEPPPVPGEHKA